MKFQRQLHLCGLLFGTLALGMSGAFVAYRESVTFLLPHSDLQARVQTVLTSGYYAGISNYSVSMLLNDCLDALNSIYGIAQNTSDRIAAARICESHAQTVLSMQPTNSYAWYISALSAAALGQNTALSQRYVKASSTAPSELWLTNLRVRLAEANADQLDDASRIAFSADIKTLLESKAGVRLVARMYADKPELRNFIMLILDRLPAPNQKRFLQSLAIYASRKGSS